MTSIGDEQTTSKPSAKSARAADEGELVATNDDDVSIEVFIEEIDGELMLDGRGASADEIQRARNTVSLLGGVLPRLSDNADAAQASYEMGTLLGSPLENLQEALEAMRDAYQRCPTSVRFARGYRKAAMSANDARELATALESEAKLTESTTSRAQLNIQRARLLETELGTKEAARFSYAQAVEAAPHSEALEALERLSLASNEPANAATFAQKLASLVTDVTVRAEHLARAARHLDQSGDGRAALALAVHAQVHSAASPAISFTVERLLVADGSLAELSSLREQQIKDAIIDPVEGWFDVGVVARCALGDHERAVQAFSAAADAAGDDATRACPALEQLSQVLDHLKRWPELIAVEKRILASCEGESAAKPWLRIATIYDECLDDTALATEAYDRALDANPKCSGALEGACRLIHRSAPDDERRERLLKLHRIEAEAASSKGARGNALRLIGELLIEDNATRKEGLETLREALSLSPGNVGVLDALARGLQFSESWKMLVDLYEHQLDESGEPSRRAWLLAQMGLIAADRLDDRPRAISALKRHMDLGETHPPIPLVKLAELLDDGSDDETQVEVLTRMVDLTSGKLQRATLLQRLAAVHERMGNGSEASAAFEDAIEVAPANHPVFAEAGRAHLRAGRHDEFLNVLLAGSRFEDDGSRDGNDRARWLVKAASVMHQHLNRTDDAVEALRRAHAWHPESGALLALRAIFIREARWEDLAELLEDEGDSPSKDELLERAVIAEAVNDDEEACILYARALDAGEKLAWLPYARLAAKNGQWEELEKRYAARSGSDIVVHHARYRAGEIAAERLSAPDRAIDHWLQSHEAIKEALAPLVALAPITANSDDRVDLLASLQASTSDKVTRFACLRRRIATLDALGRDDEALDTRMAVLALRPSDPWVLVEVELELERRGDRVALAEILRNAIADPQLDPNLLPTMHAALGSVLEQLGLLRDAVVAYESAQQSEGPKSRSNLLGLRRCYDAIEDDRVGQVLAALAACPPKGAEQALCSRAMAWWWMERGDTTAATGALESALKAHPCDYDALNDLIEIGGDQAQTRVTDAMLRAFELEEDPGRSKRLGLALATRLLRTGRVEPAREAVDRMRDRNPDDLRVLMLHAEVQEQRSSWQRAAATLDLIASHKDAPAPVRVEALLRLVALQTDRLSDPEAAKASTKRILSLDASGDLSAEVRLDVEESLGEYEAAAASLEELTKDPDLSESERAPLLLRLAALHEVHLDDPAAALATLGRVTDARGREQVAKRLIALGEETGRWDLASKALEATLEGDDDMDPVWEASLRRRLGDLLHKQLERPDAAFKHYERVIELEPDDTVTLEALAKIAGTQSTKDAIRFHRQLLAIEPDRVSSYRALRELFLHLEELDGAFCAEAMLVGLGAANDEERYFYRQRRMSGTQKLVAKLHDSELDLLFPERNEPVFQLFAALEPALRALFGVDLGAYGLDDDPPSTSRLLAPVAKAVAYLLGVSTFELRSIPDRLRATSELGDLPMVLLPSSLEDALRREQQFVLGAVLARIAFNGIGADPGRAMALTRVQIEHTIAAACDLSAAALSSQPPKSAIYADIKSRLDSALSGQERKNVVEAAKRYAASDEVDGATIRAAYRSATLRAAILCAQDPSVAVRCMRTYGNIFSEDVTADQTPDEAIAALPFAISAEHIRLRARLSGDVKSEDAR